MRGGSDFLLFFFLICSKLFNYFGLFFFSWGSLLARRGESWQRCPLGVGAVGGSGGRKRSPGPTRVKVMMCRALLQLLEWPRVVNLAPCVSRGSSYG